MTALSTGTPGEGCADAVGAPVCDAVAPRDSVGVDDAVAVAEPDADAVVAAVADAVAVRVAVAEDDSVADTELVGVALAQGTENRASCAMAAAGSAEAYMRRSSTLARAGVPEPKSCPLL